MPPQGRLIQLPLYGKVLLCLLAIVYSVYLAALGRFLSTTVLAPAQSIIEHPAETNPDAAIKYWTAASMLTATDADQQAGTTSDLTPESIAAGKPAQQQGRPPSNRNVDYPLSTVGKVFMTNEAGQNMACSGTALVSQNRSVVDTAGHCLYMGGQWMKNVIFCPLYDKGNTPYGCWAARDLEAPSDWINARPNDFHHDFGMAIVSANSQGSLTDLVGGAGWAYNQSATQPFYAYGYPAAPPYDGQTRQSCEGSSTSWQHGGGTVISIPCGMTGGSSGGPWFMKIGDNWYVNGHNDFISSLQPRHMFSPYYDDTWYALYDKAQRS